MALLHSFENSGNFLFKYRGQIPIILFVGAVPVIYLTNYSWLAGSERNYLILMIVAALLSFVGLLVRAIAIGTSHKNTSGRNRDKQIAEALNTTGIYSTMRHPLYVGNYFMWIGIVVFTGNIWYVLLVSLAFWLYYERIMFAEERFLERKFGQEYLDWSLTVPAFVPSFKNHQKSSIGFSLKTVLRREYSGITATIIGFIFVDIFRNAVLEGGFYYHKYYLITFGVAILITLILRSLKHYTKVLHEDNRS